jgi:hypothetical protein
MPADAGKGGARDFKRFSWEGVRLTVPSDWELVSTRGDRESGYVALADNASMRLQLKWDAVRRDPDPSEVAGRYIAELRKKAKKGKADITINSALNLASLTGKQTECYEWTGAERGVGMVSRCDQCSRMIHLMILGEAGESLRGLARTVFSSLRDHPEDDEAGIAWEFYDVEFRSPADMHLRRKELLTGCIRMLFQKGRRELEFVRTSMAQMLLEGKSLPQWFREFYATELKHWRCRTREAEIKGHQGLNVDARPWMMLDPGRLVGRPRLMRIGCWHCAETNRLFLVRHTGGRDDQDVFDRALQSMKCCEKT